MISLTWDIKQKITNTQTKTHRRRQQYGGHHRGRGWGEGEEDKGAKCAETGGD